MTYSLSALPLSIESIAPLPALRFSVRGWVYNSFGCMVVERGVVARVTMIAIDEDYLLRVSIGFLLMEN